MPIGAAARASLGVGKRGLGLLNKGIGPAFLGLFGADAAHRAGLIGTSPDERARELDVASQPYGTGDEFMRAIAEEEDLSGLLSMRLPTEGEAGSPLGPTATAHGLEEKIIQSQLRSLINADQERQIAEIAQGPQPSITDMAQRVGLFG